jgi:hypothetical protein
MTTEQRLEKLERQNRWMNRIGAVGVAIAIAVAGVFLVLAMTRGDIVVRSLTVVDPFGNRCAYVGWESMGGFLEFYGNDGKVNWKAPERDAEGNVIWRGRR